MVETHLYVLHTSIICLGNHVPEIFKRHIENTRLLEAVKLEAVRDREAKAAEDAVPQAAAPCALSPDHREVPHPEADHRKDPCQDAALREGS